MFKLIESADYNTLLQHYLKDHDHFSTTPFSSYPLIVPTLPSGDILIQTIADKRGVVSGITTRFWNAFEWSLIERVTGHAQYSGYAPLSRVALHWNIFSYLYQHGDVILSETKHPLHPLLRLLWQHETALTAHMTRQLWTLSGQLANIYSAYLNMRPDWLKQWQENPALPLDVLLPPNTLKKLPEWLTDYYRTLYNSQRHLWNTCFASILEKREQRANIFWQTLHDQPSSREKIPAYIPIFAPTHISASNLQFMQRLGAYSDIHLYHLAASEGDISDIVDSRWLRRLKLSRPEYAANAHYDHAHPLLSRLGKAQRDQARLIRDYCPIEQIEQYDAPASNPHNLLSALQTEILELHEDIIPHIAHDETDDSLRIHACRGMLRQCEVLRNDIVTWLNQSPDRRLSDILILLPDPTAEQATLRAVFPPGGDYDGYRIPARIVGITTSEAENLWHSLAGRYTLINGRFDAPTVIDWLLNENTCQSLGISNEHMQRITAALIEAGYKRGFDDIHLQNSLHPEDHDYRYTYSYALNRLIGGVLMPSTEHYHDSVPQSGLNLNDLPALEALATLADDMQNLRQELQEHVPAQQWVHILRNNLQQHYSHAQNSTAWHSIDRALEALNSQLEAHQELAPQSEQLYLPLHFVLEHIEKQLASQQNSNEPSGVITIGGLHELRNLPYKLIAFLNADRERYPKRQNDERYNLIDLDHARLGDHNQEQEDRAALLDLICRAQENCWIYYSRTEPSDNEPRLPASPVQELLQYLDEQREDQSRHYHIEHPSDPFEYDPAERHPAPLWQNIRQTLNTSQTKPSPFLNFSIPPAIPAEPELEETPPLTLNQLINDTLRPVSAYARSHNIAQQNKSDALSDNEPLALNPLQSHQLDALLIELLQQGHSDPCSHLSRLPASPAGINGKIQLKQRHAEILHRQHTLLSLTGGEVIPQIQEYPVDLNGITLTALLPDEHITQWPRLTARKSSPKHQYRHWLEHLAWNARSGGDSHILYADNSYQRLSALPATSAIQQLRQWLTVRQHSLQHLWLAPIELMQEYLENLNQERSAEKNTNLIATWIEQDTKKADSDDLWRHLWRGNESHLSTYIDAALTRHAPLLLPLIQQQEMLK
ncbi:MAG: exodeoxyribonuclease V subunit gamma [Cardiobacteriaceae bacterium]|nr:exodeoxyribonuclease V subunit gamma [Cardiobacteriaceae bacterium]